jgi:hypothetical protein
MLLATADSRGGNIFTTIGDDGQEVKIVQVRKPGKGSKEHSGVRNTP